MIGSKMLVAFPHAGSFGRPYASWAAEFNQQATFRVQRRPFTDYYCDTFEPGIIGYARFVASGLQSTAPIDLVLYGHSFGALVAFEVARALAQMQFDKVVMLVVSGCVAPQEISGRLEILPVPYRDARMSTVSDRILQGLFQQPHLSSTEIDAETLSLLVNRVRADLEDYQNYVYAPGDLLRCGCVVISGSDEELSEAKISAWRDLSERDVVFRKLPGDHMGIVEEQTGVRRVLAELLAGLEDCSLRV